MTAIAGITVRPLYDSTDSLLRFTMRADAVLTGVFGLASAFVADALASLTGLTPGQEYAMSAVFVLYGMVVVLLAAQQDLRRAGVGVVAANIVYTAAALVFAEFVPMTPVGVALTLAGGIYTAFFAWVQYRGLRRLPA